MGVGLIRRVGVVYAFSGEFTCFLAVSASILQHAATGAYPVTPLRAEQVAEYHEAGLDTPAQPVDVTRGHSEKRDHREQEGAGCSSGCSGPDSGPGEIFARLAQRLGVKPDAAEKMCRDDVKREGLQISPEEYAAAYLAES